MLAVSESLNRIHDLIFNDTNNNFKFDFSILNYDNTNSSQYKGN